MHPEAREELNLRLKLTVLEYAKYVVSQKPVGNSTSRDQPFTGGNRPTSSKDERVCIERSPSPFTIPQNSPRVG